MAFKYEGRAWQVIFEMLDVLKPHKRKYEYSPNPDTFSLYAKYAATASPDGMKHTEGGPDDLPPSPSTAPDSVGNATTAIGLPYRDTLAVRGERLNLWPNNGTASVA